MKTFEEATIIINGVTLNHAQSMSVRVTVTSFLWDLHDPEHRKALGKIGDAYQARLREVEQIIVKDI
jgi:hypothetical protein